MTTPATTDWRGRRVFVTGATGLLGGWMVKELLDRGAEVVALVRDGVPKSLFVREGLDQRVTQVRGGLDDYGLLRRALEEYEIHTVFHLAAQALVGVAKQDPVGTLEANIRGTYLLLEAARVARTPAVVVASSDKAYGTPRFLPYTEAHPLVGEYPYDVSKSCADLICTMYARTYGVPVSITRCGNLYGGGDLNFSRTIPGLVRAVLHDEPFVIRSDGRFVRDFLYVEDAVHAYLRLAEALVADPRHAGEGYNFSLELHLTVLELVERVLAIMGRPAHPVVIENRASAEIREQYMVATKAREALGWTPTFGLDAGIERTVAWYRRFFAADTPAEALVGA